MKNILIGSISRINTKISKPYLYTYTDSVTKEIINISAKQTNEAMIKFLSKYLKEDEINCFIALCTKEVFPANSETRLYIKENVSLQNIEYIQTEFKNKEKEIDYILEEVYEKIKKIANDDENVNIYIDMAGGRRDYFVFLQLFTKLLSFNGYSTHVFYSNITGSYCKITNANLTFKRMKFLGAVNEFVTTGNARLL